MTPVSERHYCGEIWSKLGSVFSDHVLYVRENGDLRQEERKPRSPEVSLLRKHGEPFTLIVRHREKRAIRVAVTAIDPLVKADGTVRVENLGAEKRAGLDAEHLRVRRGTGTPVEIWITREVPIDDAVLCLADALLLEDVSAGRKVEPAQVSAVRIALGQAGVAGFAVKLVVASGVGQLLSEVKTLTPKRLAPKLFELPTGYATQDL